MNGDEKDRTPVGPTVPVPADDEGEMLERCENEREKLSPHETADCAGLTLTELYENEEDGGS